MNNPMNIVYSFDENYAQFAGISLFSLFQNNRDIENIAVYIIGDNLTPENVKKLTELADNFKRNIFFCELNKILPDMGVNLLFGRSAYGRLFVSNFIDADKVFYLDSDTIVNGSLKELQDINMDKYLVAGVQDTVNPYFLKSIGLDKTDRYFNSGGVIALNLKLWKEMGIEQKTIQYIKRYKGYLPHADQTVLNNVCKGYVHILEPKYNLMNPMFKFSADRLKKLFKMHHYYSQEQFDEAIKNPVVIHYTSEFFNRPWFSNCDHPLKEIFYHYMEHSPWHIELKHKEMSRNCKIQNWVYNNCPFLVYQSMIRFIEMRHRYRENA